MRLHRECASSTKVPEMMFVDLDGYDVPRKTSEAGIRLCAPLNVSDLDQIIQLIGIGSVIIVDISKFNGNINEKGKFIEALYTKACAKSYSVNIVGSTYVVAPSGMLVKKI